MNISLNRIIENASDVFIDKKVIACAFLKDTEQGINLHIVKIFKTENNVCVCPYSNEIFSKFIKLVEQKYKIKHSYTLNCFYEGDVLTDVDKVIGHQTKIENLKSLLELPDANYSFEYTKLQLTYKDLSKSIEIFIEGNEEEVNAKIDAWKRNKPLEGFVDFNSLIGLSKKRIIAGSLCNQYILDMCDPVTHVFGKTRHAVLDQF